jgi:hypothetical protein
MKYILTALRNYLDYWRDDWLEAGFWAVCILVILIIGISDPIIWDWIVSDE